MAVLGSMADLLLPFPAWPVTGKLMSNVFWVGSIFAAGALLHIAIYLICACKRRCMTVAPVRLHNFALSAHSRLLYTESHILFFFYPTLVYSLSFTLLHKNDVYGDNLSVGVRVLAVALLILVILLPIAFWAILRKFLLPDTQHVEAAALLQDQHTAAPSSPSSALVAGGVGTESVGVVNLVPAESAVQHRGSHPSPRLDTNFSTRLRELRAPNSLPTADDVGMQENFPPASDADEIYVSVLPVPDANVNEEDAPAPQPEAEQCQDPEAAVQAPAPHLAGAPMLSDPTASCVDTPAGSRRLSCSLSEPSVWMQPTVSLIRTRPLPDPACTQPSSNADDPEPQRTPSCLSDVASICVALSDSASNAIANPPGSNADADAQGAGQFGCTSVQVSRRSCAAAPGAAYPGGTPTAQPHPESSQMPLLLTPQADAFNPLDPSAIFGASPGEWHDRSHSVSGSQVTASALPEPTPLGHPLMPEVEQRVNPSSVYSPTQLSPLAVTCPLPQPPTGGSLSAVISLSSVSSSHSSDTSSSSTGSDISLRISELLWPPANSTRTVPTKWLSKFGVCPPIYTQLSVRPCTGICGHLKYIGLPRGFWGHQLIPLPATTTPPHFSIWVHSFVAAFGLWFQDFRPERLWWTPVELLALTCFAVLCNIPTSFIPVIGILIVTLLTAYGIVSLVVHPCITCLFILRPLTFFVVPIIVGVMLTGSMDQFVQRVEFWVLVLVFPLLAVVELLGDIATVFLQRFCIK